MTTPQEALSAMRNLGVTLNDYDSTALETLCNFAESQIAALSQQAAQEPQPVAWTNQQLCELLPGGVMWGDNLTPGLVREILSRAAAPAKPAEQEKACIVCGVVVGGYHKSDCMYAGVVQHLGVPADERKDALACVADLIEVARMPNIEHVADAHNAAVKRLRALAEKGEKK